MQTFADCLPWDGLTKVWCATRCEYVGLDDINRMPYLLLPQLPDGYTPDGAANRLAEVARPAAQAPGPSRLSCRRPARQHGEDGRPTRRNPACRFESDRGS